MSGKRAVALMLAATVSLTLPFSSIAKQTGQAATTGSKSAPAKAKSRQAIAARQPTKKTAKRTTSHRPAAKKQT